MNRYLLTYQCGPRTFRTEVSAQTPQLAEVQGRFAVNEAHRLPAWVEYDLHGLGKPFYRLSSVELIRKINKRKG